MKSNIRLSLLLITVFLVCSASDITFRVMLPAQVDIPSYINTIAIIDRSVPDDQVLNIIESGLTVEGIGQDKLGTQTTIKGLTEMLQTSARFNVIRTNVAMLGQDIMSAAFPDPIPWLEIEKICNEFKADAVISLEKYDSDFLPTGGSLGGEGTGISLNGMASVQIGFRFYDLAGKIIIDEHLFTHSMQWNAGGATILEAVVGVVQKNNAINDVSYDAGYMYGKRISPSWYSITREYFRHAKGDDDLAEGARMMEANDWDMAIEALNRALENGQHRKIKGRAAHNLAVVYEILDDLVKAREYAQIAWGKYKIKPSKDYGYMLNERIKEKELLEYQLSE